MIGVILLAGAGRRLRPLTENIPKGLLIIRDQTILERMVSSCSLEGINEFIVVAGYNYERVLSHCNIVEDICDVSIKVVLNEDFEKSGTGQSVYIATKDLEDDILIISGDLVLDSRLIGKIASKDKTSLLDDFGEFMGVSKVIKEDLLQFNEILKELVDENQFVSYDIVFPLLNDYSQITFTSSEDLKWVAIKTHRDWDKAQLLVDDLNRLNF